MNAALAQPAFTTRGAGRALRDADQHTTRWAPEADAGNVRPLATLGFVDRLVTPWLETADHSPSLRALRRTERDAAHHVSWVFPRPWYRDELSWLTAARGPARSSHAPVPAIVQAYVAPSLATSAGGAQGHAAYAPLVPHSAATAASVIAPLAASLDAAFGAPLGSSIGGSAGGSIARSAGPRSAASFANVVLADVVHRAHGTPVPTSRLASLAPELVTPPAPQRPVLAGDAARGVAERAAEQRALVRTVDHIARATATREASSGSDAHGELGDRVSPAAVAAPAAGGLHATARAAASADARAAADMSTPAATQHRAAGAPPRGFELAGAPPELAAAISALPVELAVAMRDRPSELAAIENALRVVELSARASASGTPFASSRGPRVVMPAGLGGAVSAPPSVTSSRATAPASALAAVAATSPAAFAHVGWADRWLARFAGATSPSLDGLTLATSGSSAREPMIAGAAPAAVLVAPAIGRDRAAHSASTAADQPSSRPGSQPSYQPSSQGRPQGVVRYDDDAQTPDDVFAAIAASAARRRAPASSAPPGASAIAAGDSDGSAARTGGPIHAAASMALRPGGGARVAATAADVLARTVPMSPGAGVSPQLVASPFAPVLQHVTGQQAAPAFDVRALFGSGLVASYLAELVGPAEPLPADVRERAMRLGPQVRAGVHDGSSTAFEVGGDELAQRLWPSSVVASSAAAPRALVSSAAASGSAASEAAESTAAVSSAATSSAGTPQRLASSAFAASPSPSNVSSTSEYAQALDWSRTAMAAPRPAIGWTGPGVVADRAEGWSVEQQRSVSDLSLDFVSPELILAAQVYGLGPAEAAQAVRLAISGSRQLSAMAGAVDRTFVEALAIASERHKATHPTGGEAATMSRETASGAASATRASGRMIAHERDRMTDHASTEITASIATDAGQAAMFAVQRAAIGPKIADESARRPRGAVLWPPAAVAALGLHALPPDGEHAASVAALELLAARLVAEVGTYAVLGEQLAPTAGRFNAATDDFSAGGRPVMPDQRPVARGSVAGTLAGEAGEPDLAGESDGSRDQRVDPIAGGRRSAFDLIQVVGDDSRSSDPLRGERSHHASARDRAIEAASAAAAAGWSPAARAARALAALGRGEYASRSALERAAVAWQAMPVVFGDRPAESTVAERTTRAGEATDHDDAIASSDAAPWRDARNTEDSDLMAAGATRLAARWQASAVYTGGRIDRPQGIAGDAFAEDQRRGPGHRAGDTDRRVTGELVQGPWVDRPGLSSLSQRAGEALGAYVASSPREANTPVQDRPGLAAKASLETHELIRTGRAAGRHGGGEVEIPTWFEAAARKMLDERSGGADGISLAELTLVTAAPASHVAAASRTASSAAPVTSVPAAAPVDSASQIDIDQIANDVYRAILVMMDAARARNGEPFL